jgi:hypothetical protein
LAVAYGVTGATALWHFGSVDMAWVLQALPYGAMIWTVWRVAPPCGLLLATGISLVLIVTWPRFPKQVLPEFLTGMHHLFGKRV